MTKKNAISSEERLKEVLKLIQLRVQVQLNQTLTNGELAQLAGVGGRSFGDWMRGTYAPAGTSAILQLLSLIDEDDVAVVLDYWRSTSPEKGRELVGQKPGRLKEHVPRAPKSTPKKRSNSR